MVFGGHTNDLLKFQSHFWKFFSFCIDNNQKHDVLQFIWLHHEFRLGKGPSPVHIFGTFLSDLVTDVALDDLIYCFIRHF